MLRRTLFAAAAAAAVLAAAAPVPASAQDVSQTPSGRYVLDTDHASVVFFVKHFGLADYAGQIAGMTGELVLDRDNPQNSRVTITAPLSGLRVPSSVLQGELLSADWLNAAANPTITFVSTSVERTDETTARILGTLTVAGVSRPATVEATLSGAGINPINRLPTVGFSATGSLDRTEFGVSTFAPAIGADVRFIVNAEFNQAR
jgi:polyisoprenoid-binding protein YceI